MNYTIIKNSTISAKRRSITLMKVMIISMMMLQDLMMLMIAVLMLTMIMINLIPERFMMMPQDLMMLIIVMMRIWCQKVSSWLHRTWFDNCYELNDGDDNDDEFDGRKFHGDVAGLNDVDDYDGEEFMVSAWIMKESVITATIRVNAKGLHIVSLI